jgi:hypothetical protein
MALFGFEPRRPRHSFLFGFSDLTPFRTCPVAYRVAYFQNAENRWYVFAALRPESTVFNRPDRDAIQRWRARYDGLLVNLERRWDKRYEFRIAYAVSRSLGMNGVIDANNWFASYGPTDWDRRHNLTFYDG